VDSRLQTGLILALTIRGLAIASYPAMRRVAGLAEELAFDSIWLCDRMLDGAFRALARHRAAPPRDQRAVYFVPAAVRDRQDGGEEQVQRQSSG